MKKPRLKNKKTGAYLKVFSSLLSFYFNQSLSLFKSLVRQFRNLRFSHQAIIIIGLIFTAAFFIFRLPSTTGATFGWLQTDWSGGADTTNKPNHTSNQTGWAKYYSKDASVLTTGGELKIQGVASSSSETSDADFNAGSSTSTVYIVSGFMYPKKPAGYNCDGNNDNGCSSGRCDSTCQNKVGIGNPCDEYSDCSSNFCNGGVCAVSPCGASTTFTDSRDGNIYPLVPIGSQCWFQKNLAYLPVVHPAAYPPNADYSTAGYYVYGYSGTDVAAAKASSNYTTYGVLYTHAAALTACPTGSHLPTDSEFMTLEMALGMTSAQANTNAAWRGTDQGSKLQLTGANDFKLLAAGARYYNSFSGMGSQLNLWTASLSGSDNAYNRQMSTSYAPIFRNYNVRDWGWQVRCIKG